MSFQTAQVETLEKFSTVIHDLYMIGGKEKNIQEMSVTSKQAQTVGLCKHEYYNVYRSVQEDVWR
jgi:hypothetical protein